MNGTWAQMHIDALTRRVEELERQNELAHRSIERIAESLGSLTTQVSKIANAVNRVFRHLGWTKEQTND